MKKALNLLIISIFMVSLFACGGPQYLTRDEYRMYDQCSSVTIVANQNKFEDEYEYYPDGKLKSSTNQIAYYDEIWQHYREYDRYGRLLVYKITDEENKLVRHETYEYDGPPKGCDYSNDLADWDMRGDPIYVRGGTYEYNLDRASQSSSRPSASTRSTPTTNESVSSDDEPKERSKRSRRSRSKRRGRR